MVNQAKRKGPPVIDLSDDDDDDSPNERLTSEDISELERRLPGEPETSTLATTSTSNGSTASHTKSDSRLLSDETPDTRSTTSACSSSSSSSSGSSTASTASTSSQSDSKQEEDEVVTINNNQEDLEEWTVKEVLDKRPTKDGTGFEYLLKWDNYDGPPSWEPESNCLCTKLIKKFESNAKKLQQNQPPSQRIKVRKLVPQNIIGSVKKHDNNMLLVVKWVGVEEPELIPLNVFRENYPQKLIDFLVDHVVWQN